LAVTGVRQPNERVVYGPQADSPYYVRYSYAFEGLNDSLTPGEIISQCRNAESSDTSAPLPASTDTEYGLPQTRVDVRRYSRQTGQARIVVEWGIRSFSSGAAPDVASERSDTIATSYTQPYTIRFNQTGPIPRMQAEIATRAVSRPRLRTTIRRLKTESGGLGDQISQDIANNVGRLMVWRGLDRIIVGGGFQPTTQTQGYAYIVLDYLTPLPGVLAGDIYSEAGYENLPIEALVANQVYKIPPDFAVGTQGEDLDETYRGSTLGTFGWI
jgi:hypothetical protein